MSPRLSLAPICLAAAVVVAPSAAAQSLDGSTFTYEVLGETLQNTTGTATVGAGAEFTITNTSSRVTWAVDVDATGVTITPTFDDPNSLGLNWGIAGGTVLGAVRLSGFAFTGATLEITGFTLSGTAGAGDGDIVTTADSVTIGATSGQNNFLNWEPGEFLRLDLTTEIPCPWVFNETAVTYHSSISDAIAGAVSGDVLELGPCTFLERGLAIGNRLDLTIRGQGPDQTVIDAQKQSGTILFVGGGASATIEDLTIQNGLNSDGNGGAVRLSNGSTSGTFRNVHFVGNDSDGDGFSAMETLHAAVTIDRCVFRDNITRTTNGQHIGVLGASMVITNSLFHDNVNGTATVWTQNAGQGFVGNVRIVNCTFANEPGNSAVRATSNAGGSINVVNSVADFAMVGGNRASAATCVYPGAGTGNTDATPVFVDAANGDYRLAASSPGIDAADYTAYVAAGGGSIDLGGDPRPIDECGTTDTGIGSPAYLDAGAYEFQGSTLTASIQNLMTRAFYCSIQSAIDAASRGDIIELGAGTFFERGLVIGSGRDLTIWGQGPGQTIIDAQMQSGVVLVISGGAAATIEDLTIQNGLSSDGNGGAVRILDVGTWGTLRNVHLVANDSDGDFISALEVQRSNNVTIDRCVFRDNIARATGNSYAVGNIGGRITITNSLFHDNVNGNTTVWTQKAGPGTTGDVRIANCTFANEPGSSAVRATSNAGGTINVVNSVADLAMVSGNNASAASSIFPGAGTGNIDATPVFVDAANDDYRLAAGTSGIDAADYDAYIADGGGSVDLGGDPRLHDDTGVADTGVGTFTYLDMGAYESQRTTGQPCNSADLAETFGVLDLNDINTFVAAFLRGDPVADLNSDTVFDLSDINLFVSAFLAGCL